MPGDPRQAAPATNLTRPATRFIGRGGDLDALGACLRENQLVTVRGPPGVGKTRLALEYAWRYLRDDPGAGVWFCDLSEATSPDEVCAALGDALGVPLRSGATAAAQIGAALSARGRLLVVLDN